MTDDGAPSGCPGERAASASETVTFIADPEAFTGLVRRLACARVVAVDVESNGLHAYRPRLCCVQIAHETDEGVEIAIVDPFAVDVGALLDVLAASGPLKVLHDLTLDARLFAQAGVVVGNVWDTSVGARMLGLESTGLASLASSELGAALDKRYQHHDWARRPFEDGAIAYLAADVRHLLPLWRCLVARATSVGVLDEIEEESAYKLRSALRPAREQPARYASTKGASVLDRLGMSVLRELWLLREETASAADVPPFEVLRSETMVRLAAARPNEEREVLRLIGRQGSRCPGGAAWLAAITRGIDRREVPEDERRTLSMPGRPSRETVLARRRRNTRLTKWRAREAAARGVSVQAVLPGHCTDEIIDLAEQHAGCAEEELLERLATVEGFGVKRLASYGRAIVALLLSTRTDEDDSDAAGGGGAAPP